MACVPLLKRQSTHPQDGHASRFFSGACARLREEPYELRLQSVDDGVAIRRIDAAEDHAVDGHVEAAHVTVTIGPVNTGGCTAQFTCTALVTPSTVRRASSGPVGSPGGNWKSSEELAFPVKGSAGAVIA